MFVLEIYDASLSTLLPVIPVQPLPLPLPFSAPMQTLWSRSLQVRSTCRCPSCQSPLTAVARRVNTAPVRRGLRSSDLFIFYYSSIIATAAFADAKWKERKREALDNVISAAKEELKARDDDQRRRLEALGATNVVPTGYIQEEDHHTLTLRKIQAIQNIPSLVPLQRGFGFHDAQPPLANGLSSFLQRRVPVSAGQDQSDVSARPHENSTHDTRSQNAEDYTRYLERDKEVGNLHEAASVEASMVSGIDHAEIACLRSADVTKIEDSQVQQDAEAVSSVSIENTLLDSASLATESQKSSLAQNETFKILLGSDNIKVGREAMEVWAEDYTPPLRDRMRMLRQTTNAKLVYTLLLTYLESSACAQGVWPDAVRLDMPNEQTVVLSSKHKDEISRKIGELGVRQRSIVGLRHNPDIIKLIAPLPFPKYQQMPKSERKAEASYIALQNDTLRDVFSQNPSPSALFSRLCSTLLAQKFAPNIHTYNLLIILLSYFQLYSAAIAVIDALFEARLKHNEVTYAAVLNCYYYASKPRKFWTYVSQMNCENGVGINAFKRLTKNFRLANPGGFVDSYHSLKVFHKSYPSRANEKLVFLKAAKNIETYEAIITGWLNMGNFKKAMAEYSELLRGGFRVSARILEAFLRYSVRKGEWDIGSSIWEKLKAAHRPLPVMTYYWMLQLCHSCQKSKNFDIVLRDGHRHRVLRAHLAMEDFDLSDTTRAILLNRSFGSECLEQNVFVPGWESRSELLLDDRSCEQLPNLYLMVTTRFLNLVEAKQRQQGWYDDRKGWAAKAIKDIRVRTLRGELRNGQFGMGARKLRWKLRSTQAVVS